MLKSENRNGPAGTEVTVRHRGMLNVKTTPNNKIMHHKSSQLHKKTAFEMLSSFDGTG